MSLFPDGNYNSMYSIDYEQGIRHNFKFVSQLQGPRTTFVQALCRDKSKVS